MLIPHFDLRFETQLNCSHEHGLHTQLEEPSEEAVYSSERNFDLNDFVIDGNANPFVIGNAALESQAGGLYNNPETSVDGKISGCQNQIIGNFIDNKTRKAVAMQSRLSKFACMTHI